MARGVQIDLTLNPRDFIRGLKLIESGTEDVVDRLEDIEKEGSDAFGELADEAKDAGRDIERNLERGVKDSERSFEQMGRSFADEMRDMRRDADRSGRDIGKDLGGGVERGWRSTALGVVAAEAADEFVESWGEAVREGDLTEAIYETVTNAGQIMAAAIPGIGTVIGMGIATVGGIVKGIQEEQARIQEALTSAISGAGDEAIEEQGITDGAAYIRGVDKALADAATERATVTDYFGAETFVEALELAAIQAEKTGVPMQAILDIVSGTTQETGAAIGNLEDQRDILNNDIAQAYEDAGGSLDNMTLKQQEQVVEWTNQRDAINGLIEQGKGRLGQLQDQAAAVDKANEAFIRVKGSVDEIDAAIDGIPNLQYKTIEVTDGGSIARFNAAMYQAVRPAYKTIFVSEVRRDNAAASRANGGIQPARDNP